MLGTESKEKGRALRQHLLGYLDKALELCVLLQEPGLLLLQGENVLCCLLENGCLKERGTRVSLVVFKQDSSFSCHSLPPPPGSSHALPTLLSFSPSVWGIRVLRDWKPALMLCIRLRSLLLAISRRIRRSWSRWVSGVSGMLARLQGPTET